MADWSNVPPADARKLDVWHTHDGQGTCSHGYTATPHDASGRGLEPFVWLREGLNECGLQEAVARTVAAAVQGPQAEHGALVKGLMAYLSDYMDRIRKQANENTELKLRGADLETIARSTTQSLIEELHARGGQHADEDSVVLFALTGALLRTLPVEALRATGQP